ncbi:uncharacterized protein LOC111248035 isoform X1 [Varroa destructor]|uniref:Uncharacterized protein n=1 Tax=Varroa destructor TaxID=109461 RepID=A0A7M7K4E1_VARDE|nr:uncharacterized protein LOC111248035 isoform X1 [Varroa destructor]
MLIHLLLNLSFQMTLTTRLNSYCLKYVILKFEKRCCSDPEGYETQRIVFVLYEEIIYLNVSGNSFIQTNHIYQPQIKEQTPTIDQTTVSLISTDSALYPYYIESLQRNAKTDSHSK